MDVDALTIGAAPLRDKSDLLPVCYRCGAFKLARYAYDKLLRMKLPDAWRDEVDVDALTIGAAPLRDKSDLLPVCYRCGASNALLNPANSHSQGTSIHRDVCTSCGHPFVRSFLNFEVLPLIEFVPEASISDEEALDLIKEFPEDKNSGEGKEADHYARRGVEINQ